MDLGIYRLFETLEKEISDFFEVGSEASRKSRKRELSSPYMPPAKVFVIEGADEVFTKILLKSTVCFSLSLLIVKNKQYFSNMKRQLFHFPGLKTVEIGEKYHDLGSLRN